MSTALSPKLFKKSDVCARLALSARTIEGMVREGAFPPPVRMGKFVYWSEKSIDAWMVRQFGPQEAWRP